jgi:hypothetical protein
MEQKSSVVKSRSFTLTWKNAETEPPNEIGRYWCIVREVNELGVSYYQWNCAYNPNFDSNYKMVRV